MLEAAAKPFHAVVFGKAGFDDPVADLEGWFGKRVIFIGDIVSVCDCKLFRILLGCIERRCR